MYDIKKIIIKNISQSTLASTRKSLKKMLDIETN